MAASMAMPFCTIIMGEKEEIQNGKKSTEEHSVREKVQGCVLIFGKSCIILSM